MSVQPQERTFTFLGERLCLDFANTVSDHTSAHPTEYLRSYTDLVAWAKQATIIPADQAQALQQKAEHRMPEAAAVLRRAHDLREVIFRVFVALASGTSPTAADLATLNTALQMAPVQLRVTAAGERFICDWLADQEALDGILGPVAWSAANLLASDEVRWVKMCDGEMCGWLFLDTTKNHSRRWCDMADCGSRAKAKRYYRRKKQNSNR